VRVFGSERQPLPGARFVGDADAAQRIAVTIALRGGRGGPSAEELGAQPVLSRRYLSLDELAAARGAAPRDVERVTAFAQEHGLEVVGSFPAGRLVTLVGTVGAFSAAFRVGLGRYRHAGGSYRGRVGPVQVPRAIASAVEGVLGLDDRPQAVTRAVAHHRRYRPSQVARFYDFPRAGGDGECVALLQFGGGFRRADLEAYARRLRLPVPRVSSVAVGARNRPGSPVTAAVHDPRRPSVISISWGAPEGRWTEQGMRAVDRVFEDAALLGITVCCASGDRGAADGVEFPASSPHVLACGGTSVVARRGRIVREDAWSDRFGSSGGGVSGLFERPAWQEEAGVPGRGRGVPDVAGNASPGYELVASGKVHAEGGTSAVAPLWAALVARCNERLGTRVGFVNPLLYSDTRLRRAFRDVTAGGNGEFEAGPGWDAVTGWGSPRGRALLEALGGAG
jgi:kumamolisin